MVSTRLVGGSRCAYAARLPASGLAIAPSLPLPLGGGSTDDLLRGAPSARAGLEKDAPLVHHAAFFPKKKSKS